MLPTPRRTESHYPFYEHIKNGGLIWREDEHNDVYEVLDLSKLKGDPKNILLYGYLDLTIIK